MKLKKGIKIRKDFWVKDEYFIFDHIEGKEIKGQYNSNTGLIWSSFPVKTNWLPYTEPDQSKV